MKIKPILIKITDKTALFFVNLNTRLQQEHSKDEEIEILEQQIHSAKFRFEKIIQCTKLEEAVEIAKEALKNL